MTQRIGGLACVGFMLLIVAVGCDRDDTRSPSTPPAAPTPPPPAPQTPPQALGAVSPVLR